MTESTIDPRIANYDWEEAFGYAGESGTCAVSYQGGPDIRRASPTKDEPSRATFTREDVEHIEALSEGENDGPDWLCMGRLRDGRWFLLAAGCDYTGWDCQAGGTATVATSRDELLRYGTTREQAERLGLADSPALLTEDS